MKSMCEVCYGTLPGIFLSYPREVRINSKGEFEPCDCLILEFNENIIRVPKDIVKYIRSVDNEVPESEEK